MPTTHTFCVTHAHITHSHSHVYFHTFHSLSHLATTTFSFFFSLRLDPKVVSYLTEEGHCCLKLFHRPSTSCVCLLSWRRGREPVHCLCKNLQTCLPTSRRPGKSYLIKQSLGKKFLIMNALYSIFFRSMIVSSVGLTTCNTAQSAFYGDTDCGCRLQATPSLEVVFPTEKSCDT